MKENNVAVLTFLIILINGCVSAQTKIEKERLKLAHQFMLDIKRGTLSNREVMKKYVVEGDYFKMDSIKGDADFYLDMLRMGNKQVREEDIASLKYTGNEDRYSVTDRPIGQPERTQRLKFILYELKGSIKHGTEKEIDIDDLYVVEYLYKDEHASKVVNLFVLFTERNKILAFANFPSNNYVSLFQF